MSSEAKVLGNGIVHMPERKYPAAAIQGDSLSIWLAHVEEANAAIERGDVKEAQGELAILEKGLRSWLAIYEETLRKHGFDLPYVRAPKKA